MQLNTTPHELYSSGIKAQKCIIYNNSVIFHALTDGIYKDQISTIAREILANAKDACNEAKVKTPIKVHLPTALEPIFSIQDFGIGMDLNTVLNVFCNYGNSTKSESNDQIGAFGLGSKTPMMYCGQFSVTSVKDGHKCIVQMFKDADGLPNYAPTYQGDSDEPNGTCIEIPANNQADYAKFQAAVEYYATYLDYPVKCNRNLNLTNLEYAHKDEYFAVTKQPNNEMTICMGGIPYKIQPYTISNQFYDNIKGIKNSHIILYCNIGDIDITTSREEVKYSDKTKSFIKTVFDKIGKWLETYKQGKTQFELYHEIVNWMHNQIRTIKYGCDILYKDYHKYKIRQEAPLFKHYMLVDDISRKFPWKYFAKKANLATTDSIGFFNRTDLETFLKTGIPQDRILDINNFGKIKRGPRQILPFTIVIKGESGGAKRKRVSALPINAKGELYVTESYYESWRPGIRLLFRKNVSLPTIVYVKDDYVVPTGKSLLDYIKQNFVPSTQVRVDRAGLTLKNLGYIKYVEHDYSANEIANTFGIYNNTDRNYNFVGMFPLLNTYCDNRKHINLYLEALKTKKPALYNFFDSSNPLDCDKMYDTLLKVKQQVGDI